MYRFESQLCSFFNMSWKTFALLLTLIPLAHAQPQNNEEEATYQSLNAIHQMVREYVKQKIDQKIYEPTISLRKLSSRLKLKACKGDLKLKDRRPDSFAGRMSLSVNCVEPRWRVFVPVTVNGKQPVLVATNSILRRAVIKPGDVKKELRPYKKIPHGSMQSPANAIGMRTKRAIAVGDVIKIRHLQPPYWVFKNKQVNIITRIGGIEVKTSGVALKSGVVDEQVPVENASSEKIIKGIVIAPNTVLVP